MNAITELQTINQLGFAFRDISGNDKWESFTVTATLTLVGAATYVGRYRICGAICYFQISAVAATSIASTAGTSFFDLPRAAQGIGGVATMTNATTRIAVGDCHIDVPLSRAYVPAQVASGNTFNVCGWFEIGT